MKDEGEHLLYVLYPEHGALTQSGQQKGDMTTDEERDHWTKRHPGIPVTKPRQTKVL